MDSPVKQSKSVDGVHIPQPTQQLKPVQKRSKRVSFSNLKLIIIIIFVLLAGVTAFSIYKYNQVEKQIKLLHNNPQAAATSSTQQLVDQVGKLVKLPSGETPSVAIVSDAAKLNTQPFFADAMNGDKVLIYTQAKRAVLYRPSLNRVIEYTNVSGTTSK